MAPVFLSLALLLSLAASVFAAAIDLELTSRATTSKRGLAFPNTHPQDILKAKGTVATWQYGWDVPKPNPSVSGITHVPMLWGEQGIANFAAQVKAQGAKTILTFNEPERGDQSNLSPSQAAQLWLKYIQPLKKAGVRLGSPAVSSAPEGIPWLQEFIKECKGCSIDFLAFHWYGDGAQWFEQYLQHVHSTFPKYTIWVTEYASTSSSSSEVLNFLEQTTKYMDSVSWVEKYSWFIYNRDSGMKSNLLDSKGNLNALGKRYLKNQ